MKIAAVIPAYNEEEAIAAVVAEINAVSGTNGLTIVPVVVNDCSKDKTAEIIDGINCVPIHLPVNLGIGGGVQTGFRYALENGFDFAIQVDGDGQHPAEEIPRMVAEAVAKKLDVTIGSRFLEKEGFQSSFMRRTGINYFRRLNKMLTGLTIYDTTSGFRLLNRKALEIVNDYYPDEYPEPEAIVLYARNQLTVGEFPVQMRERQGGVSSINSIRAVYYMWKVTLACVFTRIRLM